MAIIDLFKPKKPQKRAKRSYSAATAGRLYNDFEASLRSPDSEIRPVLSKMRARSRDLARNNEYVRKYLDLLKSNVVGSGFNLQVKAVDTVGRLDMSGNQAIEAGFKAWGRLGMPTVDGKMSWADVQKFVIENLARDGEVIAIKHRGARFKDGYAIEFLEPDQLDEEKNEKLSGGREIRMGVELDQFKKPVAYHFLTYHPGDYDYTTKTVTPKHTRLTADRVIHIFKPLRAGQTRGEPWMVAAIPSLKQLGALREAAIINARIGASKMGFFVSPGGDGFVADDLDDSVPIMTAEPGTFHQLPQGVDFKSFEPQYPSTEFDSFHTAILRGIASALSVSYASLSNDLERTSYSSVRQGALEEREAYREMQTFLIDHFVRPVYEGWLESAMEMGSIGLPIRQFERFSAASHWQGRGWSWVDPLKESSAIINALEAGIISLQDAATHYGKDAEDLLSQLAKDKDLAAQFGISYAYEPFGAQKFPVTAEGQEDDGPETNGSDGPRGTARA